MYIAVGVVGWVFYARLMRGRGPGAEASTTTPPAARVMGYTDAAHPVPPPPAQRHHAGARLLDDRHGAGHPARARASAISGLGAQPPAAEWGVLIADGKNFMTHAPGGSRSSPASPSCSAGLGFSLAGDGLADLLRREALMAARGAAARASAACRSPSPRRAASLTRRRRHRPRRCGRARCWAWSANPARARA